MPSEYVLAAVGAVASWVWWVDRKVSAHEVVIEKLDKLIDLMLSSHMNNKQH